MYSEPMHRRHLLRATLGLLTASAPLMPVATQAAKPKAQAAPPSFTQLPILTVFTPGKAHRHGSLSVEIGLHAANAKLAEKVPLHLPRLRDTYVTVLQAYATTLSPKAVINTQQVSQQLQAATDRVVGEPGLKVLIGSIILN